MHGTGDPYAHECWVRLISGGGPTVCFTLAGRGRSAASLWSCSEVWLQERRSEQHAVRLSLFIREEMKLQPQPHIDSLICGPRCFREVRKRGKKQWKPKMPTKHAAPTPPTPTG
ncbi:hypothetical protein NHX12_017533 [Muraenolepis orangiensis]|uniref:Uncharacterized protein n=1 Tax=Muraenolepis orangiensis TaxID=630683 RepID=A0A9Q0EY32_9TELE|nr:hypothetical protein NHX12_017533 [Muraenolepis orangiensis]